MLAIRTQNAFRPATAARPARVAMRPVVMPTSSNVLSGLAIGQRQEGQLGHDRRRVVAQNAGSMPTICFLRWIPQSPLWPLLPLG